MFDAACRVWTAVSRLAHKTSRRSQSLELENIYFDTSAFNYLLRHLDYRAFLGTRDLQTRRGRRLLISPVVVWELLVTPDERTNDFLVFSAQHLFAPEMLAQPTELILRHLEFAYPDNKANYNIFTSLPMGDLWRRMATDPAVTFSFNTTEIQGRAAYLRRLGTNLAGITGYPGTGIDREEIRATAEVVNTMYEALQRDGFLPRQVTSYDPALLYRLVVMFALVTFVFELDLDPNPMRAFWAKIGITQDAMIDRLRYVFETYPKLLERGPLLEMAAMAYHQLHRGRRSRGALFDSMHMAYAPYVREIISADEDFRELREADPRYKHRIRHVEEIHLRTAPYWVLGKD